jgi:hypothetical protein
MSSESKNLNGDLILLFCQNIISRHPNPWPPTEQYLACEFVLYFKSFWFITINELEKFCLETNIELTQKSLPCDLLASNCFFNGKRIIELDDHPQNLVIQPHTILHEIRELLEYVFCDLGYPIADSAQIELRANEFASLVMLCGRESEFAGLINNALEIQPVLLKFGALLLLGAGALAVIGQACLGAMYPELPSQRIHQSTQRYLT